jgi:flagellar hook-length control protein FliK
MTNVMLGPPTAAAGGAAKGAAGKGRSPAGPAGAGEEFMALIAGLLAGLVPETQPTAQTDSTAPGPNDGKVPEEPGADAAGLSLPQGAADAASAADGALAALAAACGQAGRTPQGRGTDDGTAVEATRAHGRGRGAERTGAPVPTGDPARAGGPAAVVSFTITRTDGPAATTQVAPAAAAAAPETGTTPAPVGGPAPSPAAPTTGQDAPDGEAGTQGGTTPSTPANGTATTAPAATAHDAPATAGTMPVVDTMPPADTTSAPAATQTAGKAAPVASAPPADETGTSTDATPPAPVTTPAAPTARAPEGPTQTALPAHAPRQLAYELVGRLRMAVREEGKEIRLQLRPPELGNLTIRVVMHDGVLQAHIAADRPEAAKLLEQSLGHLEDMLADRGFELGGVDVDAGGPGFDPSGANANAASSDEGRHGHRSRHSDHGQDDQVPVGATVVPAHDGDIDLLA